MARESLKVQAIKSRISIPMYFYNIIVPNMPTYYNGDYPCDFDSKPVVKCPIHDEDTPSMRYYEETNSFYCFGCRAGGDVINLHRLFTEKMNGDKPDYDSAVEFLYQYFIVGRDLQPLKTKQAKVEFKNDPVKMVVLTKYIDTLENALLIDNSIKLESKQRIWDIIDNIKVLLSFNKIDALEAKQKIQEVVRLETCI